MTNIFEKLKGEVTPGEPALPKEKTYEYTLDDIKRAERKMYDAYERYYLAKDHITLKNAKFNPPNLFETLESVSSDPGKMETLHLKKFLRSRKEDD